MRETRLSGSVEGVMGDHDLYSDYLLDAYAQCQVIYYTTYMNRRNT